MTAEFPISIATLPNQTTDATTTTGSVKIYTKKVGGITQAFAKTDDGSVYQMTPVTPITASVAYAHLTNIITLGGGNIISFNPNVVTTRSVFQASRDSVTLAANTMYKMRGDYFSITGSGAGGGFAWVMRYGGTATYDTFDYNVLVDLGPAGQGTSGLSPNVSWGISPNGVQCAAASNTTRFYRIEGIITTISGGTFIPQFVLTNPSISSSLTLLTSSYLELVPLGPSSFTQQGGWS